MWWQFSFICGCIFALLMAYHWRLSSALSLVFALAAMCLSVLYVLSYQYRVSWLPSLTIKTLISCSLLFIIAFLIFNQRASQLRGYWESLQHQKHDINLRFTVDSLIHKNAQSLSYTVKIHEVISTNRELRFLIGQSIKLKDYRAEQHPSIQPCDQVIATIRLKPVRGTANAFGFDYERFAFSHELIGSAYIRQWHGVERAQGIAKWVCINRFRQNFKSWLHQVLPIEHTAWLQALALGDKSSFSPAQRSFLSETQLAHLFVISGLHVGIAAAWFYVFALFIYKICLRRCRFYAVTFAAWFSIVACLFYVAATGSSLSAMRALLMVVAVLAGKITGFTWSIPFRLGLAFIVSFLLWPLSLLNTGFWLSYLAVLSLYVYSLTLPKHLISTYSLPLDVVSELMPTETCWSRCQYYVRHFIVLQVFIFICLLPITYTFNQSLNFSSPVINLIAIPVVSGVFVPLSIVTLFQFLIISVLDSLSVFEFIQPVASVVTQTIAGLLSLFIEILTALHSALSSTQVSFIRYVINPSLLIFLFCLSLLLIGLFCRLRWFQLSLATLLMLVVLCVVQFYPVYNVNQRPQSLSTINKPIGLEVQVFDVGQGLSILIKVGQKTLLYDTGKSWSGGSMAESVVLPYLKSTQNLTLDILMLSHLDNDHAGGTEALLKALSVGQILTSDKTSLSQRLLSFDKQLEPESCVNASWVWGQSTFNIYHPRQMIDQLSNHSPVNRNDRSCVLLVTSGREALLLLGDISRQVEQSLLKNTVFMKATQNKAITLLLAHHGSRYSSHSKFLAKLKPQLTIASAAYLNRFKHPHPDVRERLKSLDIPIITTPESGQISLVMNKLNQFKISKQRTMSQEHVWNIPYAP